MAKSLKEEFTKGIIKENPVLRLMLGTCATLAVTTAASNAIGMGLAIGKSAEGISRQPEASNKIQTNLLLGAALAEGTAIFGFVVALIIILFLG